MNFARLKPTHWLRWPGEEAPVSNDDKPAGIDDPNSDDFHPHAPLSYPRDLDKVPPRTPAQEFLNRRMSQRVAPQKRDVDAITADIRANEREIVRLETELSAAGVRGVELRYELGQTLDEIEHLAREARKTYRLETPDVQPPQAGPPGYGIPAGTDPGHISADPLGAPAGAGASSHSEPIHDADPRFTPVPHQERGDDEIPF